MEAKAPHMSEKRTEKDQMEDESNILKVMLNLTGDSSFTESGEIGK